MSGKKCCHSDGCDGDDDMNLRCPHLHRHSSRNSAVAGVRRGGVWEDVYEVCRDLYEVLGAMKPDLLLMVGVVAVAVAEYAAEKRMLLLNELGVGVGVQKEKAGVHRHHEKVCGMTLLV